METNYASDRLDDRDDYRIMPSWCSFVLGSVATFLLVYLGIARPTAHELDRMRRQVGSLEQSVWEVAATRQGVAGANSLLTELTAQQDQLDQARVALEQVAALRRQVQREAADLRQALATVAELGAIKESLLSYSGQAREAAEVVSTTEHLCQRLAESSPYIYEAMQAGDDLLALRNCLLQSPDTTQVAAETLHELLGIRQQLADQEDQLPSAQSALQELVTIKSIVLAQQPELASTLETLEAIQDLSHEFGQASESFTRIRKWMVEVVAVEPLLERARQSLAPLSELASLRHLDATTLRQLVRALDAEQGTHVARNPQAATGPSEGGIRAADLVVE